MTVDDIAAKRYAQAFFDRCKDRQLIEEGYTDVKKLHQLILDSADFE